MRSGFLVQQAGAQPAAPAQQPVIKPDSSTAPAAAPTPAQAAASSGAPPPQRTAEQLSAGLAECLELLKGPSDERRCGVIRLTGWGALPRPCVCRAAGMPMVQSYSPPPPPTRTLLPHAQFDPAQVCGPVAGDQAAAGRGRCHDPRGARSSGAHLFGPPAAAAVHPCTTAGGGRSSPESSGQLLPGAGSVVQLCAGSRPGGLSRGAGKAAPAAERGAGRRRRPAACSPNRCR